MHLVYTLNYLCVGQAQSWVITSELQEQVSRLGPKRRDEAVATTQDS